MWWSSETLIFLTELLLVYSKNANAISSIWINLQEMIGIFSIITVIISVWPALHLVFLFTEFRWIIHYNNILNIFWLCKEIIGCTRSLCPFVHRFGADWIIPTTIKIICGFRHRAQVYNCLSLASETLKEANLRCNRQIYCGTVSIKLAKVISRVL